MRSSELQKYLKMPITRDCDYNLLGFIETAIPKTLVYIVDKSSLNKALENENISGIITTAELSEFVPLDLGLIVYEDPYSVFNQIHDIMNNYYSTKSKSTISVKAIIHPSAIISEYDVIIGDDVLIEENVVIKAGVVIGKSSIIRSNTVLGGEGYEVKFIKDKYIVINHNGKVLIGQDVEIQYNCCVDKGILGKDTIIQDNTKINNLCHIAHCVNIGNSCRIGAKVSISGSVVVGDDVWIGPGSTISNGLNLGSECKVTIGSTVLRDVPSGQTVTGYYAQDHKTFLRNYLKLFKPNRIL
jgi:UDP-3-O-[3-hydroxymyristoyl] glucosamine N-acyltransferase LpxD